MFRYIGNKSRLVPSILQAVSAEIGANGVVADVMAGTGTVSTALRSSGYKVIASDVMTYSRHHLVTQLLLDAPPNFNMLSEEFGFDDYRQVLNHLNSLGPKQGYFYREFSPEGSPLNGTEPRKYFTGDNAAVIDAIRLEIEAWKSSELITDVEESVLKHDLIMAANEVANISGTYGYFLSKFTKNSLTPLTLKPTEFTQGSTENEVLQGYAEHLATQISADLCYIDPPYIKRQYAANYHILETLARGDEPEAVGKSGLRPWRDQYSNLCTKTKSLDSFRQILGAMDCPKFLISYSEDGLFPVEQLMDTFGEFGSVELQEIEYKRFRSNNSPLGKKISEYLIHVSR